MIDMNQKSPFLDLSALSALSRMRFVTKRHIEGAYSGRHQSRQQGGAGEFVDFREYSGSEDLRRLDWKTFGRTGKAFVRLHQEETNLICTLAIDASESMRFGDRKGTKLEYAQFLATALSHLISQGQDQVGLAVLDEELRDTFPPGATTRHIWAVQEAIEQLTTRPTTKMSLGLERLFQVGRRRGVLMLISDFLMEDLEACFAALRQFRHRGWEVITLHLIHPDEERLPEGVACRFEGLEGEGSVDCSPDEIRVAYQETFSKHLATVRQMALASGCDYRRVSTAVSYLETLGGFLVERSG